MQHSGADDQIEGAPQIVNALDRQLMNFQIVQPVLSLEVAGMPQARLADVNGCDARGRFSKCVPCRLRGAAARHEDFEIPALWLGWPRLVKEGAVAIRIG